MTLSDIFMTSLIQKLWTDQVGSSISAEMALVTSVTIGALVMTMAQFSATVNREFQNSAEQTGLTISDLEKQKEEDDKPAKKQQEKKAGSDEKQSSPWGVRRSENCE